MKIRKGDPNHWPCGWEVDAFTDYATDYIEIWKI